MLLDFRFLLSSTCVYVAYSEYSVSFGTHAQWIYTVEAFVSAALLLKCVYRVFMAVCRVCDRVKRLIQC